MARILDFLRRNKEDSSLEVEKPRLVVQRKPPEEAVATVLPLDDLTPEEREILEAWENRTSVERPKPRTTHEPENPTGVSLDDVVLHR